MGGLYAVRIRSRNGPESMPIGGGRSLYSAVDYARTLLNNRRVDGVSITEICFGSVRQARQGRQCLNVRREGTKLIVWGWNASGRRIQEQNFEGLSPALDYVRETLRNNRQEE